MAWFFLSGIRILFFKVKGDINKSEDELFFAESVYQLFKAQKFIEKFITDVIEREKKAYESDHDPKLLIINAAKRLQPYSHQNTKNSLAEKFGVDPDEIGRWKYTKIFRILAAESVLNAVKRDYAKQK